MKFGALLVGLIALILAPVSLAQDKPNVVLMLSDNLGWGDLSVYNQGIRGYETANIDSIANEGLRFTQFLVEPGCTPSRAGLLTGRYSVRAGLSLVIIAGSESTLQDEEVTIGELFKSVGYSTAYFGKWHLGPDHQSLATSQGYDEWRVGFSGTTDASDYEASMTRAGLPAETIEAVVNGNPIFEIDKPGGKRKPIRPYTREYRKHVEGDIATAAVDYIKKHANSDKPFHMLIGWTRPHFPNVVPEEFKNKSSFGDYGDSLLEHDYQVGRVLDALGETGIEDNTIVIYLSDNGPTRTTAVMGEVNHGSAGPFTGELGDAKEGSIRTAGMIKWPGKIAPDVSNEMIAIHDFFPTLASIIGAKLPDRHIDGVDQSDWLLGKQEHSNRDSMISFIGDRIVAVRWKHFRIYPVSFIPSPTNPGIMGYGSMMVEQPGYPRVYNIEEDPREERADIDDSIWVIGQYSRVIKEYFETLADDPNPPQPNMTDFR